MGALPRPDLPPGPQRELIDALHDLHHRAGWPSLRTLAREAGCSHTTVSKVMSSPTMPTWGVLELLVEAMGEDTAEFHRLWLAASAPEETRSPEVRIAGRRAELAAVRRHLETGAGLLLVTGEAGIGKTKLVTAAVLASRDCFVATGSCLPLSTEVPMLPITEVLQAVYEVDDGQWIKEALADCPRYVPGSIQSLLPDVAPGALETASDEWSRQRLLTAITTVLKALGSQRRLALMIEDVHWADAATLDFLEYLSAGNPQLPVLLTCRTADPGTPDTTLQWVTRMRRLPATASLELAALDREETAEQLTLLDGRAPEAGWVERIHTRGQGLPLFTEQLAAHAADDQTLPTLLAELLDQRLADLGEDVWLTVRALAVADRTLSDVQLGDVTGLTPGQVTAALHTLRTGHLLAAVKAPHDVRLRHPMLAEAARRRLAAGEATQVHASLAETLGRDPDASAAEVAEHWQRAEDPDQEIAWRIRAARGAQGHFAFRDATSHWRRVVDLWPEGSPALPEPTVKLTEVYAGLLDCQRLFDPAGADRLTDHVLEAALAMDEATARPLLRRVATIRAHARDSAEALAMLDDVVRRYEAEPPCLEYVFALRAQERVLHHLGRYHECSLVTERAVAVSRSIGATHVLRAVLGLHAWYRVAQGFPDEARQHLAEGRSMAEQAPDLMMDAHFLVFYTDVLLLTAAPADEVVAASRDIIDQFDDLALDISNVKVNASMALRREGRLREANHLLSRRAPNELGDARWIEYVEGRLVEGLTGDLADAARKLDGLGGLNLTGKEENLIRAELSATLDVWLGRDCVDPILEILDVPHDPWSAQLGALLALAARAAADRAERARWPQSDGRRHRLVDRLASARSGMVQDPLQRHPAYRERPAQAATWTAEMLRLGETSSLEHWLNAASEWDRLTRPHDTAYCRWRGAQVATANGQAALATKLLRRAAKDAREHVPLSNAIAETAAEHPGG